MLPARDEVENIMGSRRAEMMRQLAQIELRHALADEIAALPPALATYIQDLERCRLTADDVAAIDVEDVSPDLARYIAELEIHNVAKPAVAQPRATMRFPPQITSSRVNNVAHGVAPPATHHGTSGTHGVAHGVAPPATHHGTHGVAPTAAQMSHTNVDSILGDLIDIAGDLANVQSQLIASLNDTDRLARKIRYIMEDLRDNLTVRCDHIEYDAHEYDAHEYDAHEYDAHEYDAGECAAEYGEPEKNTDGSAAFDFGEFVPTAW